jgi:membrane fusion protein, protease secretion system
MALLKKVFDRAAAPANDPSAGAAYDAELRSIGEDMRNPQRPMRWGVWLLVLGFLGFIVWAVTAPINEGVPAPATVAVEMKRQTVQHLTGGIVREILVREAQLVTAGDVVMRLDDTVARASYQAVRQQYFSLRAQESRLEAERAGVSRMTFHPDLVAVADDPLAAEYMRVQSQLFLSRRNALQGQQAILEQTQRATRDALSGLTSQLEGKQAQLKIVREQLTGTRELAKEGYLPRNRWFDEERLAADLNAAVGELTANIARTRSNLAEVEMRIVQLKREFLRDVETQLADTRRDAEVAAEKWRTAREELVRTEIRSPADGYVVGLAAHTVGGVVQPGARIMDVIPKGVPLTLEARVEPHLIDRIRADLPADIRFSAFINDPNLVIEGRVLSVSADLVADQPNIPPYYLARVAVTPDGMKALGPRQLQPGMPAEVIIKTGERTFMHYLLAPIIRRIATSFREA